MASRLTDALQEHPSAGLVPAMGRAEYRGLLADISQRGIVAPLEITRAGVVLDGRHRLRAARELGIARLPVRVVAPTDEVSHMVLAALSRRQLSPSQRAALAVELEHYQRQREHAHQRRNANLRQHTDVATLPHRSGRSRELAAQLAGVGARTVQDAETVRRTDPRLFEAVKQGRLPVHTAARRVRQARRDRQLTVAPLPRGRYQLLYADPPWQLGNPSSAYAPENHYPTMPLNEICALPVPAADHAVLFLWAVASKLPEALQVMRTWGFHYRTNLVWVKDWIGLGTWVRHRHEHLLIGSRGDWPPPQPEQRVDSVIEARRGRHSEKPACVYELLEQMYPEATKLELFARGKPRHGWHAWGNEVDAV